ncbi:MAG TPA: tetratricopeptide repeat protein [Planctomycetota bacterium]|nr:tetratricopeptide repeat protein [Planctomycetota bacterium]
MMRTRTPPLLALCFLALSLVGGTGILPVAAAETPEALLKQAQQLEDENKTARAADQYRAFLKSYPDHTQVLEARYCLAKCLDSLGLVDEALLQLDAVAKSADKRFRHRADALLLLGKLHGSLKSYDAATKVLEQLLAEGAGLYEEEALHLAAGYYAVLKKFDDSAAKLNLLKRRENSRFAEEAAYKLAVLWLKAENLDLAIEAVGDLAARFPQNKHARGLMLQIAELCRRQKMHTRAIATCEQLVRRFPKSREAEEVGYILALCQRDRKEFDKAIETLEGVARVPGNRTSGLAAEALIEAADIFYAELNQPQKAMARYEEAAKMARDSNSERRDLILEQCYFRLAEYQFMKKNWSVALEYYVLLRKTGSKLNVLGRILKCQAELGTDDDTPVGTAADLAILKKKIEENPGTLIAAEAEVFLADRAFGQAQVAHGGFDAVIEQYEGILKKYPRNILSQGSLESYVLMQLGLSYGYGETRPELKKAMSILEKAVAVEPETPYRREILEGLARAADQAGDKQKAFEVYERLFASASQKVEAGKADEAERGRMSEYLRAILSRAERKDSIEEALRISQQIAQKSGPFSEAARHAMFYMGELYYLKKDFATAAKTFQTFIKAYGPKQDAEDNVINAPWKPAKVDEQTAQVYEAAVRVAHSWFMQGHFGNMLKAYQWMVANIPHQNQYVAEAQYWLAMELVRGKKAEEKDARTRAAEALWTKVVNPSFDFDDRDFAKKCYFWVNAPDVQDYVKTAILKAGQFFSESGDHERAAEVFRAYLRLYPEMARKKGRRVASEPDPKYRIARYALGREYITLGQINKLVECYKVYLDSMRDDEFRVSALQLLGYNGAKHGQVEPAIEAYATLLDEYGQNEKDEKGEPVPVPQKDRIRSGKYNWDGIRLEPPKGLDLGEVRFSLGFLYWKKEKWAECVKTLAPFAENPQLFDNKARPKALFMAGQGYYRAYEFEKGLGVLLKLLHDHPTYEAVEEVSVYAARGAVEAKKWSEVDRLYQWFLKERPRSAHRPHMDLYAAIALIGSGKADEGLSGLRSIALSDTYQDVKADAYYHWGSHLLGQTPPKINAAFDCLEKSVALYPRETSCLAAGKAAIELKDWEKAQGFLQRAIREFPAGRREAVEEAKRLLPDVQKRVAKGK